MLKLGNLKQNSTAPSKTVLAIRYYNLEPLSLSLLKSTLKQVLLRFGRLKKGEHVIENFHLLIAFFSGYSYNIFLLRKKAELSFTTLHYVTGFTGV